MHRRPNRPRRARLRLSNHLRLDRRPAPPSRVAHPLPEPPDPRPAQLRLGFLDLIKGEDRLDGLVVGVLDDGRAPPGGLDLAGEEVGGLDERTASVT